MIDKTRILVYQSEDNNALLDYLQANDFNIVTVNPQLLEGALREGYYDLCILDHCPDTFDNLKLLKAAANTSSARPILFISRQSRYEAIIEALNEGADDYIVRPCNYGEVIARIRALIRRSGITVRAVEDEYKLGNTTFNTETGLLIVNGVRLKLSKKEALIMALLFAYKGEVLSRDMLLRQGWQRDDYYNSRALDVYMSKLRGYLRADMTIEIKTISGAGYSLIEHK